MAGDIAPDPLGPPAWVSADLWRTVVEARDKALAAGAGWDEAIIEARMAARGRWPALPLTHLREAIHALEGAPQTLAIEAARSAGE